MGRTSQISQNSTLFRHRIGLLEARAVAMSGVLLPSEQEGLPQRCNFLDGDVICSVEDLVIRNAQDMGWQGLHCEGSLFSTIFGLLFWDVILVPLEATMLTAYQAAPLDWMTDSFYARLGGVWKAEGG